MHIAVKTNRYKRGRKYVIFGTAANSILSYVYSLFLAFVYCDVNQCLLLLLCFCNCDICFFAYSLMFQIFKIVQFRIIGCVNLLRIILKGFMKRLRCFYSLPLSLSLSLSVSLCHTIFLVKQNT
jgi:hypothetical protein